MSFPRDTVRSSSQARPPGPHTHATRLAEAQERARLTHRDQGANAHETPYTRPLSDYAPRSDERARLRCTDGAMPEGSATAEFAREYAELTEEERELFTW